MTARGDVTEAVTPSYHLSQVSTGTSPHAPYGHASGHVRIYRQRVPDSALISPAVGRANGIWPRAGAVLPHLTSILGV